MTMGFRRVRKAACYGAVLAVLAGGISWFSARPAAALGAGRICMFLAPNAAAGAFGHVGWAFDVPGSSEWIFGSTDDNANGDPFVWPGQFNGAWSGSGSFGTGNGSALDAFRMSRIGYTVYRCTNTPGSTVGAAIGDAQAAKGWGYALLFNNCLDHAVKILNAYLGTPSSVPGSLLVPPASSNPNPADYFYALSLAGWERPQPL